MEVAVNYEDLSIVRADRVSWVLDIIPEYESLLEDIFYTNQFVIPRIGKLTDENKKFIVDCIRAALEKFSGSTDETLTIKAQIKFGLHDWVENFCERKEATVEAVAD